MREFLTEVWKEAEPSVRSILAESLVAATLAAGLTLVSVPVQIGKYLGSFDEKKAHMLEDVHFYPTAALLGIMGVYSVFRLLLSFHKR